MIDKKEATFTCEMYIKGNRLEEIVKGKASPCSLCIGCEVEDNRIGYCNSFVFSERKIKESP
jgi:hypothetical protein